VTPDEPKSSSQPFGLPRRLPERCLAAQGHGPKAGDRVVTAAMPDAGPPAEPRGGVLANRDFVKLFAGESVSLIGTYITQFTMPLVAILALNATVLQVGLLNAIRVAPVIVVALFAGVWLDRSRRRPVLIACSLSCAVLIGLVPLAQAAGLLSLGLLYVVAALAGALNVVFDVGALSYVPNLVEPRHLPEANGKLQATESFAGIAGPGLAGLLIGLITAPITLSADAVSYLFSAAGLISIRQPEPAPEVPEAHTSVRRQIAEGFAAVYGIRLLRTLLSLSAALNLAYGALWTIFVVYAVRVLHLSPFRLGIVVGSAAVGALCGALLTGRVRQAMGLGRNMVCATIGVSVSPLLLLIPRNAGLLAMLVLVAAQFIYGVSVANLNVNAITLRQVVTPRRLLARMNATYRMLLFGVAPVGAIAGGLLGTAVGLHTALLVALIGMMSPLLWLFSSPVFRLTEIPSGPASDILADVGTQATETDIGD
jgi:MFS family permease